MAYQPRFPGPRWQIVGNPSDGVEQFALLELQREIQRFLPYVVAVRPEPGPEEYVLSLERSPSRPQGFTLARSRKGITIQGHDPSGLLHGVQELRARLRPMSTLDALPDFSVTDFPRVERRGIWTWGYVVYDYRRFLDAMARLRMNTLTLWNDCVPQNARDVIEHARSRGIRLLFGFHWGWGTGLDLSLAEHRRRIKEEVLRTFRTQYRPLDLDGIYFQTLTEHHTTETGGRSTAAWACALVNDIAAAVLEEKPGLRIEFGLHATSILDRYADLRSLDPRVTIVWEDAGVIPFSYNPVTDYADAGFAKPHGLGSPEATLAYSKSIAALQPEFALVPKGWITLRWEEEFEHHGPFVLGERDPEWIRRRLEDRRPRWDCVNALWLKNYPHAARFYRDFVGRKLSVSGLIEDGMLEERIQPSVALFAETLWNPDRPPRTFSTRRISGPHREAVRRNSASGRRSVLAAALDRSRVRRISHLSRSKRPSLRYRQVRVAPGPAGMDVLDALPACRTQARMAPDGGARRGVPSPPRHGRARVLVLRARSKRAAARSALQHFFRLFRRSGLS